MWTQKLGTSIRNHRMAIFGAVISLCAASSSGAQTSNLYQGVQIQTGLLTFATGPDRSAEITVTELGAPGSRSTVRVTFYDESDRAIFSDQGELLRGQPVHVVLPLAMPERSVRLRASIVIVEKSSKTSVPVAVLESVDIDSLVMIRASCAPPEHKSLIWCPPPAVVMYYVADQEW